MKLELSRHIFEKKLKYQVSSKSVQREPSCSLRTDRRIDRRTDGRTDMTKLRVAFCNFANVPKMIKTGMARS